MSISLNDHENRITALEKRGLIRRVLFDAREVKKQIFYDTVTLKDNVFNYDFICVVSGDYITDKDALEDTAYTMVDVNMLKSSIASGISCINVDVNTAQGMYLSDTSLESFNLKINENRACMQGYWLNVTVNGTYSMPKNNVYSGVCAIIGYKWGGGYKLRNFAEKITSLYQNILKTISLTILGGEVI